MKVRLTKDCDTTEGPKKAGDVIDHPEAHLLVELKVAVPVESDQPNAS